MSPQYYGRITGWGKCVPRRVVDNFELEQMVETSDEWIRTRTGIVERRIAGPGETTATMSVGAAREAMRVAGISESDLDLIIIATSTPDHVVPPVSSLVQDMLGARCGAFTLVAGCTGWVYGLVVAQQFIQSGAYETILVVGAETISRNVDWSDRTTCVLFGDAAGAVIMQRSTTPTGVLSFELGSDGSGAEHLIVPGIGVARPITHETIEKGEHYLRMNGPEIFKFAARTLGRSLNRVLAEAGMSAQEIDLFIPHQANHRIVEAAARLMHVPEDRFYMNIQRYGNTSAASIPVALCEAIEEGRCKPGDILGLVGFGAGLTWASAVVHLGGADDSVSVSLTDELFILARAKYLARRTVGAVQGAATDAIMAVTERLNLSH
nr:ketoacyl-ACP synthase III [Anaerolineae bacterium]